MFYQQEIFTLEVKVNTIDALNTKNNPMKTLIKLMIISLIISGNVFASDSCHPEISPQENNYIIGYGSLMQRESRKITHPNAQDVYPIELKGFKRLWGIQGNNYKTTFLTLLKDKNSSLNAVYYPAADYDILEADEREECYCRISVPKEDIEPLGLKEIPDGKYWVYTQKNDQVTPPNKEYPMVQSYVDIFLDGCIQIGNTYNIKDFLDKCVTQTYGWPIETGTWVNDRIHPRRPFATPNAFIIDKVLAKEFEDYYHHPID